MVIINTKDSTYINVKVKFTGVIFDEIEKSFKKNNLYHRYYGPAYITHVGYKSWCFNGKRYGLSIYKYNQKQFFKDINKKWLL